MKPKPEKENPWEGSNLVSRVEPVGEGVIPWAKLSEKQKQKFAAAFLADDAWTTRVKAFKRAKGDRHAVAAILHKYQVELRKGEDGSSTALRFYASMLEQHLMFMIGNGDWKGFEWLADYGQKHCKEHVTKHKVPTWLRPSGVDECRHFGLIDGKGDFPSPKKRLNDPEETGRTLAANILRVFAELAGMEVQYMWQKPFLETPPPESDGSIESTIKRLSHKSKPVLGEMTPKRLPTKQILFEKVTGDDPGVITKHFSKAMNALGLGGLPDARGGDMRSKRFST